MKTKENLLRAFAGECMASARYQMAACTAKKAGLEVLQDIFTFTANQEHQHAMVFYNLLKTIFKEDNVTIMEANYPVDLQEDVLSLLKDASHHENQEAIDIYREFSTVAREEGFGEIAIAFSMIADIEKFHHQRFKKYASLLESEQLFSSVDSQVWMCMNCGFIYEGNTAPLQCPVCKHNQGYMIRIEDAPYSKCC